MKVEITFRHMEHTQALDELIREKSQKKLENHLGGNSTVNWVCWTENKDQIAEIKVNDSKKHLIAKAHDEDMYKSIDKAIDKMISQLGHAH